ncbi:protein trunk [Phlebotomus argentipes]|uniref:protein trunk n=1 Tax=Phlebotomus argentipes TaxID=94469 RepID=UPI002892CECE|nr:protein trunk [Phlebotomus argentipes]
MRSECVVVLLLLDALEGRFVALEKPCGHVPTFVLMDTLGPAFNYRYMRFESPKVAEEDPDDDLKRDALNSYDSFYVTESFTHEINREPAWSANATNFVPKPSQNNSRVSPRPVVRARRSVDPQTWSCDAKVRWQDLGPDYFPRYLRSVECVQAQCYYGHYDCRPRSFAVRLLRRRRGECALLQEAPVDLWVWEERSVAMCCDCVLRQRSFL